MGWETDKQVIPCGSVLVGLPTYPALGRYYGARRRGRKWQLWPATRPSHWQPPRNAHFVIFALYNRDLHGNVLAHELIGQCCPALFTTVRPPLLNIPN